MRGPLCIYFAFETNGPPKLLVKLLSSSAALNTTSNLRLADERIPVLCPHQCFFLWVKNYTVCHWRIYIHPKYLIFYCFRKKGQLPLNNTCTSQRNRKRLVFFLIEEIERHKDKRPSYLPKQDAAHYFNLHKKCLQDFHPIDFGSKNNTHNVTIVEQKVLPVRSANWNQLPSLPRTEELHNTRNATSYRLRSSRYLMSRSMLILPKQQLSLWPDQVCWSSEFGAARWKHMSNKICNIALRSLESAGKQILPQLWSQFLQVFALCLWLLKRRPAPHWNLFLHSTQKCLQNVSIP